MAVSSTSSRGPAARWPPFPGSYNEAVRWSRDPKKFGKGPLEGATASETAGNAAAGGSMVPMMVLGVPGAAPAAVILGALMLRGLGPGPNMLATNGVLVYTFAWAIILSGITTYVVGSVLSRALVRMISVPVWLLAPGILLLSVIGAFAFRSYMVDVYFMLGIGIFCYLVSKIGFHPGSIGLGLILAPVVEPRAGAVACPVRGLLFQGGLLGIVREYRPHRVDGGVGRMGRLGEVAGQEAACGRKRGAERRKGRDTRCGR